MSQLTHYGTNESFPSTQSILENRNDTKNSPSLTLQQQHSHKKSYYSKSHNNAEENSEQITSLHSSQAFLGGIEQDPELFQGKSSQIIQSQQNSQRSIQIKMNASQSQEETAKGKHQREQSKDAQDMSQNNTPSSIKMNPNLAHIHRAQFLKKQQSNWHEEIDVQKYKPHQIHQKIDNLNTFDQNLDNKEAVELLKCILSKHPGKRNSKEIHFVRKCLKNVKFFSEIEKQLPEDLILRLCKFLSYERYPQFHRLYRAGDFGRKFYIILDGGVFILTPSITKTFDSNIMDNKEEKQIKQMIMHEFEDTPRFFPAPQNFDDVVDDSVFIQSVVQAQNEGFNIKKTLEKGESFGEIALRTEGIRTASVVCKEDTHFVSITATTYNEVIDAYHDLLYKEKIDFLRNVSIFQRWSLAFVHEIMMQVDVKQFKRGDILYEEGEKSKDLYFVRSGEVEVKFQFLRYQDLFGFFYKQLQQTVEIKDQSQNFKGIPDKLVKSNHIWNEKIKNSKLKKCSLVILGPYQYFGDYEIFKKSKRITRAVCYSNSEIFVLEKKEFFENMQFINMVKEIHNLFKEREIWYQGMIKKNINTEAQINKIIQNSKPLQIQIQNDTPVVEEKTKRLSIIQEKSQKSIVLPQNQDEKSKYSKVQIDSQINIPEDMDKYQQSSFLDKINIYRDFASPKSQEQELFYDQLKMREKNQLKSKKQEQAMDNVIKLRQFVGRSMNLLQQIESAKIIPLPSEPRVRRSEQILPSQKQDQTIASFQQIDDILLQKNSGNTSNQFLSPQHFPIKHFQQKSTQNLPTQTELSTPYSNQYFSKNNLQQRNSVTDNLLSNQLSPRNILTNKSTYTFKRQAQTENNTPVSNNSTQSPYFNKIPLNQSISSKLDQKKLSHFNEKGSLENKNIDVLKIIKKIDYLANELEKNVKLNKNTAINSDDNLNFIKSQIDANKKSLIRQKMEQSFTHKYLCEKTGRYKIPSSLHMIDQDCINGQNSSSLKDLTDRNIVSTRNIQNKINHSFNNINNSHTFKSNINIDENTSKENLGSSNQSSPIKNQQSQLSSVILISLPSIIVSPKLMNKEINFSKSYKKGKKQREYFDEQQQKRTLKLC